MNFHKTQRCLLALLLLLGGASGCISEYNHPDIEETDNLLVVEGIITSDTTHVRLSRSIGLSSSFNGKETYIDRAELVIESESGTIYTPLFVAKGKYTIPTGELNPDDRYRLRFQLEGMEYASEFKKPLITPAITAVDFTKQGPGHPIYLNVSTRGQQEQSRYYNWAYEEVWQTRSSIMATALQDRSGWITQYDPYSPYYYCWKSNNSSTLLLGSSDKLSENVIDKQCLAEFDAKTDRFLVLHHIKFRQNSISKQAYDYFSNLQKNIESSGSIFAPLPSEMNGNIICISNPGIPVIGYIEVSTTEYVEQFTPSTSSLYEYTIPYCPIVDSSQAAADLGYEDFSVFHLFFYNQEDGTRLYAFTGCIDCRADGGTKMKPDFWPNDDY